MVERVVTFESSKEHYIAGAVVVWCFDDRFYKLLKAFGKQREFKNIDLVKVAGGAKALAGDTSPDRDFILGQIKASIRLHDTKGVVLMLHRDCGAYGGSKHFSDGSVEQEYYFSQLKKAKEFLMTEIAIPIETYFADFDGLSQVSL
jgi:hypothetical protein